MWAQKQPTKKGKTMREIKLMAFLVAAFAAFSAGGCARPPAGGSGPAQSNKAQTNANAQAPVASPLYAQTLRGDVERAGLAISTAHNSVKQEQWSEAVVQLRAAQKSIDEALGRKPRLKEQFEALKTALGKAIQTAENRSSDVEAQFTELQTRINGLKVYTGE